MMQIFFRKRDRGGRGGRERNMSPWSGEVGVCNFFFIKKSTRFRVVYIAVKLGTFQELGGAVVARST